MEPLLSVKEALNIALNLNVRTDNRVERFLLESPPRDIELFLKGIVNDTNNWRPRTETALQIRLAEDAAKTVRELIEHTEKLTKQTDTQIQNSQTLSKQTDVLITESQNLTKYTKGLYWLTAAVVVFTVVLVVLGCIDYHDKHKEWVNPLFNGHH